MRSLVVALPYLLSTINVRILSHIQRGQRFSLVNFGIAVRFVPRPLGVSLAELSPKGRYCLGGLLTDLSIGLLQYAQVSQSVKTWR